METIYKWFGGLFSSDLAEHLSGWDETAGDYVKTNLFSLVGAITLCIAILFCVSYYYIINHPRFNRWWNWLSVLFVLAVLNFGIALWLTISDLSKGNISSDIASVSVVDCISFGFVNLIIGSLFFIICSLIIKWGSRNCKFSPFIKF